LRRCRCVERIRCKLHCKQRDRINEKEKKTQRAKSYQLIDLDEFNPLNGNLCSIPKAAAAIARIGKSFSPPTTGTSNYYPKLAMETA
jgi:hypothetical protein